MNAPGWIRDTLQERGVAYLECHHPLAYTAQEVAQREHVSGHRVAKVVVVMADDRPVELVLPASRKILLEQVRQFLGAKTIRLATETEMEQLFGDCEIGAIPPLDHWTDVPLVMDSSMRVPGDILFQAGTHRDAIRMSFRDWFQAVHPTEGTFSRPADRN